jgi:Lumenal portion of Cytochrome b559, alpha (gene psbE) subunit.
LYIQAWPTMLSELLVPDIYFQSSESNAPVVTQRYEAKSQLILRKNKQ